MKLNPLALPFIFDNPGYYIRRKLTIVISQPWNELTEEATITLNKLIQAVNIPYHNVPIIHTKSLNDSEIIALNTSFLIGFGIASESYTERYLLYQINHTRFILADDLITFCGNKSLKRQLWDLLQQKFRSD